MGLSPQAVLSELWLEKESKVSFLGSPRCVGLCGCSLCVLLGAGRLWDRSAVGPGAVCRLCLGTAPVLTALPEGFEPHSSMCCADTATGLGTAWNAAGASTGGLHLSTEISSTGVLGSVWLLGPCFLVSCLFTHCGLIALQ